MDLDGPGNYSARREADGDRSIVVVVGEVDMSTADDMLRTATADGARGVTLDLRAVTFFDSAAIHALIRLAERYPATLQVIPSPQVLRVLDISGLGGQPWLTRAD